MKHLSLENFAAGEVDRSPVNALAATGTVTLDCSQGNYFTCAPTANITLAISNAPASSLGQTIMVRFTQDSTARTVTWPASFKWAGGTAGALSTTSGAKDLLAITTFDGGTTWFATLAKAFS